MVSGEEESTLKASYYRLMVYAALFGALSSLLTVGYITILKHTSYHIIVTVWPTIKKTLELYNSEPNKAPGLKYEKSGDWK
jgi:hypothetical protein